jgi:hypothetical protein
MPDRFEPPFVIRQTDESFWIEDVEGRRFGYIYWRDQPMVGTDNSGRVSRHLALRTVKWIARAATEAAKKA